MTTIPSYSKADALATAIGELVRLSLADGVHPADLSAALSAAAMRISLQFGPKAAIAFAVVMKAAGDVVIEWITAAKTGDDERDASAAPIGTKIH